MGCTNCENLHGEFVYPPGVDNLQFNYADTLRSEWKTDYEDDDPCVLSLYWWVSGGNWTLSNFNTTVPCNGTEDVPLNIRDDVFLAQLNLNHTYPNGSSNLILTGLFNVNHDTDVEGKLWKLSDDASASTSATTTSTAASPLSAGLETVTSLPPSSSIPSHPVPTTAPATSGPATTQSATTTSKSIGTGAIAGIVVGAILGITLLAGLGFFFFKRRRRQRGPATPQAWPQTYLPVEKPIDSHAADLGPPPSSPPKMAQRRTMAELSAAQVRPAELDAQER